MHFTVQVKSINEATFFEGLFLQARTVHSDSYDTGTFDVMGDSELEVLNCGNSTTDVSLSRQCFIILNIDFFYIVIP